MHYALEITTYVARPETTQLIFLLPLHRLRLRFLRSLAPLLLPVHSFQTSAPLVIVSYPLSSQELSFRVTSIIVDDGCWAKCASPLLRQGLNSIPFNSIYRAMSKVRNALRRSLIIPQPLTTHYPWEMPYSPKNV